MQTASWIICLWPGLTRLWLRGRWQSLAWAVAFAALVNFALLASFVWPELVSPTILIATWLVVAIVWVASVGCSFWKFPQWCESTIDPKAEDLFEQAQGEYLRRDWYRAETLLLRLLHGDRGDVDARLMLAGLYRHTGRTEQARKCLDSLDQFERSEKWRMEIRREREKLESMEKETPPEEEQTDNQPPNEVDDVPPNDTSEAA